MFDVLKEDKEKEETSIFDKNLMFSALKHTMNYKTDNKVVLKTSVRTNKKNPIQTRTRRSNGQGSIFQRKSDGRWCGSITLGYDKFGKQKRKCVYGHSKLEVTNKLVRLIGMVKNCDYLAIENNTFGELMFEWLMVFKKNTITSRSFAGNIGTFRNHIETYLGKMKLYDVNIFVLQQFFNNMFESGYAVETIKKSKHLLNQFFEYAMDNAWVQNNPILRIKLRNKDKVVSENQNRYKALKPYERPEFIDALYKDESNFVKPMCLMLMFTGLRIGEVIALKWKDVNFERKTLNIERAITQEFKFNDDGSIKEKKTIIGTTKTMCSIRTIPITNYVIDILSIWKEKQKEKSEKLITNESFIFCNDDGSVRTYSGCKHIFDRFKKRNDLKKLSIGFHGLRHTFSNMLFENKENPKAVQQFLGHKDVKTTIRVYNSVDNDYLVNTMNNLEYIIENKTYTLS